MKVGLFTPLLVPFASPSLLTAFGRMVDERGYDEVWLPEHLVMFDEYESKYNLTSDGDVTLPRDMGPLDPIASLGFLAAATTRVRLATGILILAQRNPVYTAKELATVDWLSGGRLDVGVGVGWSHEEYAAAGVSWARRGARTDEYLDLLRAAWTTDPSVFTGEFYQLPECRVFPKPIQAQGPRIMIGGESNRALERVADRGNGWFGINLKPEAAAERVSHLGEVLGRRDRSLSEIEVVMCTNDLPVDPGIIDAYARAGVDQIVMPLVAPDVETLEESLDGLQALIDHARSVSADAAG